jgi:hypothetical protein
MRWSRARNRAAAFSSRRRLLPDVLDGCLQSGNDSTFGAGEGCAVTEVLGIPVSILKDLGIVGAIATVTSAIITGLVALYFKSRSDKALEKLRADLTSRNNDAIERLKAELTYENKVKSARVDYEYDARKRLYEEVEPVVFAAHLAAASLRARLITFAERIRSEDISLDKTRNWLATDPYFLQSTAYRIFLPMVYHHNISKRISHYDFTLEPLIGRKFIALAVFDEIPTGDFDLAAMVEPKLPYAPYADVSDTERRRHFAKHTFQGVVRGDVQRFTALMTLVEDGKRLPTEWYQFEQQLADADSPLSKAFTPIRDILFNFHPESHPIVWRALIAYVLLAEFFVEARDFTIEEYDKLVEALTWKRFDYRHDGSSLDEASVASHFEAARLFVRMKLTSRFRTLDSVANAGGQPAAQ